MSEMSAHSEDDEDGEDGAVDRPRGGADEPASAAGSLFDLRVVIAVLFVIYGVVLTVMGLSTTSAEDLAKAGGLNLNLWSGVGMLALAAGFALWVGLRPLRIPQQDGDR